MHSDPKLPPLGEVIEEEVIDNGEGVNDQAAEHDLEDEINAEARTRIEANIRKVCEKIGQANEEVVTLPEVFIFNAEALRGIKVVMADDSPIEVASSIIPLAVATDGNFDVVIQESEKDGSSLDVVQMATKMAEHILDLKPGLVIMDYNLLHGLTGDMVIKKLRDLGYEGKIVGSSGNKGAIEIFAALGVPNNYDKRVSAGMEDEMVTLAKTFADTSTSPEDVLKLVSGRAPSAPPKYSAEELLEKLRQAGMDIPKLDGPEDEWDR